MVEVILTNDVEHLGQAGQIVSVRPGYARNYLFPNALAAPAAQARVKELEHTRRVIADRMRLLRSAAEQLAEQLQRDHLLIEARVGANDKMFGSITTHVLQEKLVEKGFEIDRRKIALEKPIHMLGAYEVPIKLDASVVAKLVVWVVRPGETEPPPPPPPEAAAAEEPEADFDDETWQADAQTETSAADALDSDSEADEAAGSDQWDEEA